MSSPVVTEAARAAAEAKRRRARSIAIALGLGFLVAMFYAATIVHLGGNVANRAI
ncbi:MAG: hypothetical protein MUC37_09805 [Hyphomicrobium sp.]|nr:hypothetical protein [Hyphomicrobium sp.]